MIKEVVKDPLVNLALDTIAINKQALVFVNTKRSAEKVSEDIAKAIKKKSPELEELSNKIKNVLGSPTKQCERLAYCAKYGTAFHHSGLHSKQKELVEDAFRKGLIKIIGCTPTLAAGLDLPAYRSIIRDYKRYTSHGMTNIPVLEFLQMAGRAGRPNFDAIGENIVITNSENERDFVVENYLNGSPEDILSKLAVEPVLRTYLLSLISSRIIGDEDSIYDFFNRTFWAYQFEDPHRLSQIIERMLSLLIDWEFLMKTDQGYRATSLGRRVAELYIDPLTAYNFMCGLRRAKDPDSFSFLHLVCFSLEMRPLIRVRQKEYNDIMDKIADRESSFIAVEPSMFDPEYEDWVSSVKTAFMLEDWMEEKHEEWILEQYNSRPGETRIKVSNADWLLYGVHELARIMKLQHFLKEINKVRFRLRYGVKEELLPLIRLSGIGRARARKLFNNGFKDVKTLKNASLEQLSLILGKNVALKVVSQL